MKHLIIIGVGGFAREVCWYARESLGYGTEWDLKGFLDGDVKLSDDEYEKLSFPVLGNIADYDIQDDDVFICAVGDPAVKFKLVQCILQRGGKFINLIHRTASICSTAKMGVGNILAPLAGLSDHAAIGNYVTINCSSGVAHDSNLGDYSTLSSWIDIMGNVSVGKSVFMAGGAKALPHSTIEDNAYVGVSSIVFKRVKAGMRVFGNPAMPI